LATNSVLRTREPNEKVVEFDGRRKKVVEFDGRGKKVVEFDGRGKKFLDSPQLS